MKRVALFLLLVLFLASCKESPESIIQKNIEMRGGKTNFDNIKNIFMSININTMGMEVPVKFYIIRPSTMRTEVKFGDEELITVLLPDTCFAIVKNTFTALPPEAKNEMRKNLENQLNYFRSELMNFSDNGGKLISVAKEKFKGKDAHKFKISYPDGSTSYFFIDPNSYLNIGSKVEKTIEGQKVETETIYSDYRKTNGLMVPFKTEIYSGKNLIAKVQIDSIAVNKPFDKNLFIMN